MGIRQEDTRETHRPAGARAGRGGLPTLLAVDDARASSSARTRLDGGASAHRVLVVTADEARLDDILRLAAAAAAEVDVVHDVGAARSGWSSAPLVILGTDLAVELDRAGLPRREGVVLIGTELDDASVWELAIRVGASEVKFLPEDEAWVVGRLADCAEQDGPDAPVVCTLGGRGGAGASTLAAGLATVSTGQGWRTMLIDGDPLGGGIDLLVGGEDLVGLRWPQLAATRGRVSAGALAEGLPQLGGLAVLSWDRGATLDVDPGAMSAVLRAAQRCCEVVVVDLPRGLGAASRAALGRAALTLVVVPAEVRATAAAAAVCAVACATADDVRLVVRGPAPSGLTGAAVSEALGLPLAGFLRPEPSLVGAAERGEPPARRRRSPLARLCETLIGELVRRPAA